jgi:hypothetical protein
MQRVLNTPGAPSPSCLHLYTDSDLQERSRYCVVAMLNGGPIWAKSRLQHSVATDITDAESYAYSIGAVMAEVLRGRMEDMGLAAEVGPPIVIATDNDATLRIASDAASAKRALHILRRLAFTRHATDLARITAIKIDRALNLADLGTHYSTRAVLAGLGARLRGAAALLSDTATALLHG